MRLLWGVLHSTLKHVVTDDVMIYNIKYENVTNVTNSSETEG